MKFYRYFNYNKARINKLTAIYSNDNYYVLFYKNGKFHNAKNASNIILNGQKSFWLNDKLYGTEENFTKKSWRKFVKLQAFL